MMALVNAWAAVMVLLALKFLQIVAVAYKPMAAVAVVAAVDPVPECWAEHNIAAVACMAIVGSLDNNMDCNIDSNIDCKGRRKMEQ